MSGCASLGITAAMLTLIYLMVRAFTAPKQGGNGAAGSVGAVGAGATQSWGTDPKTGRQITVQVKGDSQWQWATITVPMAKAMPPGLVVGVRPSPRIALAPGAKDERAFYALADSMGKSPERVTGWAIPENRSAVLDAYWKLQQGFQIRGTTISANVPVTGAADPQIQSAVYILAELAQRLSAVVDAAPGYGAIASKFGLEQPIILEEQTGENDADEDEDEDDDANEDEDEDVENAGERSDAPASKDAPPAQAASPAWGTPLAVAPLPMAGSTSPPSSMGAPSPFAAGSATPPSAMGAPSPFAASSAPGAAPSPFAASSAPGAAPSPTAASSAPGAAPSSFAASSTPGAAPSPFAASSTPGASASPFAASSTPGAAPSPFAASSAPGASASPNTTSPSVGADAPTPVRASMGGASEGAATAVLGEVVKQPSSEAQERFVAQTWAGRVVSGEGKVSFSSTIFGRDTELEVSGGTKVTVELPVKGAGVLAPKVVLHLPAATPQGVLGYGKVIRFEGEVKGYRGIGRSLLLLKGRLL